NDELQRLKKSEAPAREVEKLEAKRERLQSAEATSRERAKQEQATGDAIYWPIFNLDIKNPAAKEDFAHLPPEQLADAILRKEQRIAELMVEIKQALATKVTEREEAPETASRSSAA